MIQENPNKDSSVIQNPENIKSNTNETVLKNIDPSLENTEDPSVENISMESASYLQSIEEKSIDQSMSTFEVDSIELSTPDLFSSKSEDNSFNQDNNTNELNVFENSNAQNETRIKEPEMFEENNQEEDFEIPAFLRRQKN